MQRLGQHRRKDSPRRGTVVACAKHSGSHHQTRTARAKRMPKRDRAAVAVDMLGIVGQSETTRTREHLSGKGFIDFDAVKLVEAHVRSLASNLWIAGTGPMPMIRGATPAAAMLITRARGCKLCLFSASADASSRAHAPSFMPEALPAVMVLSAPNSGLSLANFSSVTFGARMFVFTYGDPFVRHLNWRYLFGQPTFSLCLRGAPLAAQGIGVLTVAIEMPCSRARLSAVCVMESTP